MNIDISFSEQLKELYKWLNENKWRWLLTPFLPIFIFTGIWIVILIHNLYAPAGSE